MPIGKAAPAFLTTGFALGMAFEQGNQAVNDMNERIRKLALEAAGKREPIQNPLDRSRFL